ncbi:hypothetical protein QJS10_CPA10g01946 [Acorus calamus]|uniref:Uncharacterized protein n=1 Tax=Acorus calamus TaxID=4465 RepID=A0AAV9DZL6_ACOCL|nr:hypothetical protein QJS10_CPA10g01946 [Acorus calamus]
MDYTRWTSAQTLTPPPPHAVEPPPPPINHHHHYHLPPPPYAAYQHHFYHPHPVPFLLPPKALSQQRFWPPAVEPYVPPPNPYSPYGGYGALPAPVTHECRHECGHIVATGNISDESESTEVSHLKPKHLQKRVVSPTLGAVGVHPSETKEGQSVFCEVCRIQCDTNEVLEIHRRGKKHKKNVLKLEQSLTKKPPIPPTPTLQIKEKNVTVVVKEDAGLCEVCRIHCDTSEILEIHRMGKKHKKNMLKLEQSLTKQSRAPPAPTQQVEVKNLTAVVEEDVEITECGTTPTATPQTEEVTEKSKNSAPSEAPQTEEATEKSKKKSAPSEEDVGTKIKELLESGTFVDTIKICEACNMAALQTEEKGMTRESKKKRASAASEEDMETEKNKLLESGTSTDSIKVCEACNVVCNSKVVFGTFVDTIKICEACNMATLQTEEKDVTRKSKKKRASAAVEDVETKKKKLLESGTSADTIRVCKLCNVVCNSEVVFDQHVMGLKHLAMVKKQREDQQQEEDELVAAA